MTARTMEVEVPEFEFRPVAGGLWEAWREPATGGELVLAHGPASMHEIARACARTAGEIAVAVAVEDALDAMAEVSPAEQWEACPSAGLLEPFEPGLIEAAVEVRLAWDACVHGGQVDFNAFFRAVDAHLVARGDGDIVRRLNFSAYRIPHGS